MFDELLQWEISNAGVLVLGIVAAVILIFALISIVAALSTPEEKDKPTHMLGWSWASIILSCVVLVGVTVARDHAVVYPTVLLTVVTVCQAAAEILIVMICIGTIWKAIHHDSSPDTSAPHASVGYVVIWSVSVVILVFGWLPPVSRWLNELFGVTISVGLWGISSVTCVGAAVLAWLGIRLSRARTAGAGAKPRPGMRVLAIGVGFVTVCAGLSVTLYQFQKNVDDDLATMLANEFHQGVEFLDSSDAAIRTAGLYELAGVADDYARHPELDSSLAGRDSAIDVIVTYLKTPFAADVSEEGADEGVSSVGLEETVRAAVSGILHDHLDASDNGACSAVAATKPVEDVEYKGRTGKGVPTTQPTQPADDYPADEVFSTESATIPQPASGKGSGPACWADHRFDFRQAEFWQADFKDAYFSEHADFSQVLFHGDTDFSSAVFEQGAAFGQAQFVSAETLGSTNDSGQGWVCFNSAVFRGPTDFSDVQFGTHVGVPAGASVPGGTAQTDGPGVSGGTAQAGNVSVVSDDRWDISFVGTAFDGDLTFHGAVFDGSVTFDQAEFSKNCYVDSDGKRNLGDQAYDRACSEEHPEWDNADFTEASFAAVCADQCRAGVDVEFTNTVFYSTAVFTGARSSVLPEFWQARFWADAWLDIDLRTPTTSYIWCVPFSDDMPSSLENCWQTSDGHPWRTRITPGPEATLYLDHQIGHEDRCTVGSDSTDERLKDSDLACS